MTVVARARANRSLAGCAVAVACAASAACGGAASSSRAPGGPATPAAASGASDAPAPNQDALGAPGSPVAIGATIPPYGCVGSSPTRRLVACVHGVSGNGAGGVPVKVTLAFAALAPDVTVPEPIPILHLDHAADRRAPDELPLDPALRAKLQTALDGFVRWAPMAELGMGKRSSVLAKGVEVRLRQREVGSAGEHVAAVYDAALEVRSDKGTEVLDTQFSQPLSGYRVRLYDTPAGFVIERTASVAEEGKHATWVDAWSCADAHCQPLR